MLKDHHLALKEITAEVGISIGLVHSILTEDLWMWRVLAKIFFLAADRGTKRAYRGKENTAFHFAHVIQDFLAKNCMPLLLSILSGFGAMQFLALSKIENYSEKKTVLVIERHHAKIVRRAKEHSGGANLEDFPEVTEVLGKV